MTYVRTAVEIERRRRIMVSVWAYAYEVLSTSLVSDDKFDEECKKVDVSISTDNVLMDTFFREHFFDYTGQWVHFHPEPHKLDRLTRRLIKEQNHV